ncbi:MAG: fibro-slime domain-containing protein [Planctomycetes bacterium]|nr:fibro-slime domain-containing protein [Planctomycetota bacterium]
MNSNKASTLFALGLIGSVATVSFVMPDKLSVPMMYAAASPETVTLTGTVRDFPSSHPDFNVVPDLGYGAYAGSLLGELDATGKPQFGTKLTDFELVNGGLVPGEPYAARISVLGSAIGSLRVTVQVKFGEDEVDPFGPFHNCNGGNVNDDDNPRHQDYGTHPAGTPITVLGRSWDGFSGSCSERMTIDTSTESPNVLILRDGDALPDIDPFGNQATILDFLSAYVDADADVVTIADNQAIYLFEVGTTDLNDATADFQDLVVLVTLARQLSHLDGGGATLTDQAAGYQVLAPWTDVAGRAIAPSTYMGTGQTDACGNPITDVAGTAGSPSTGGITSAETFSQWFTDAPGTNLSARHDISLTKDAAGVYRYETDTFHPIDGKLLGNEGDSHNDFFTYSLAAEFTYDQCTDQFIEFGGGDGAWLFINGRLVMDLGGVRSGAAQHVSLDRLGLTSGQPYTMQLFYAQRDPAGSPFRLRTTLELSSDPFTQNVSAMFD